MTAWNNSPSPEFYEAPDPPAADDETNGPEWCSWCCRPKIESTVFVPCSCPEEDDDDR